jgi:glycosyltransferase involved in cell wall biosynthesis
VPPRGYGATERIVAELAQSERSQGHHVDVVDFTTRRQNEVESLGNGHLIRLSIRFHRSSVNAFWYLIDSLIFSFAVFRDSCKRRIFYDAQVLHFHSPFPMIAFELARRLTHRFSAMQLVVLTNHNPRWMNPATSSRKEMLWRLVDVAAMLFSGLITFESEVVRSRTVALIPDLATKSVTIWNAADNSFKTYDPVPGDQNIVLNAARIAPQKNQLALVQCMPRVLSRCPNINFCFVGLVEDRGYYDNVVGTARLLGVSERLTFFPPMTLAQLRALQERAGIHVQISTFTGFDLAVAESLALGKPLVASRIPPNREVIRNRENALLVDPDNIAEIADAIIELNLDDKVRRDLSAKARETFLSRLNWDVLSQKLLFLYSSTRSAKQGSRRTFMALTTRAVVLTFIIARQNRARIG